VDDQADPGTETVPAPRVKRPQSDAQRAGLARAQEVRRANIAARKNAAGLVPTSASEIRELQTQPLVPPAPDPDDDPDPPESEREPDPPFHGHGFSSANGNGRPRSIDELVVKHRSTAPPIPTVAEVAQHTRIYAMGSDPIPPPELNPLLQDGVAMDSELPPEDLVGDHPPRSIEDLMSRCPMIGNGQYYIRVERKGPPHYSGVVCKGLQRSIQRYMTPRDFVREYGGGDYALVLYGPPKRGGAIDPRTGVPRVKALTAAVNVSISTAVYPPNLQAAVLDDDGHGSGDPEDEEAMRFGPAFQTSPGGAGYARPTTTADAKIFEAQLTHEERLRDREEKQREEARAREEAAQQRINPTLDFMARGNEQMIQTIRENAEKAERLQREQLQQERRDRVAAQQQAEAAANRPADAVAMLNALVPMLKPEPADAKAVEHMRAEMGRQSDKHSAEVTRLSEKSAAEIARITTEHRGELTRLADSYRSEMDRVLRGHSEDVKRVEDRLREQVERAEKRAEEAERKAEARIRDTDDRSERRLTEVRDEMRRQMDERERAFATRLEDERRQHDRDTKSQQTMFETRLAGQKDMYENRLSTVGGEITRITSEADRYRKEAEENKDIAKHIERAEAAATALGWGPSGKSEDEGPKDWKEMMGRIGMDLVQKLPEIVQSAGETVRNLRAPGATPEQMQAAQYQQMQASAQHSVPRGMMQAPPPLGMQSEPLRFSTEGGIAFGDPRASVNRPPLDLAGPPPMTGGGMEMIPHHAPMVMGPPLPQQPQAPMQPAPAVQQAPQAQAAPASPAVAPQIEVTPDLIHKFAPALEQALASGETPENVARTLLEMLGPEQFGAIVAGMNPQRIVVELQRAGRKSSPLVRRAGQQFLRDLWAAGAKLVAGG